MDKKELEELKRYILREEMYYLNSEEGTWMQRDGKFKLISDMGETHIMSSIRLIEKNMKSLERRPDEIVEELEPLAEKKLQELRTEYLSRI